MKLKFIKKGFKKIAALGLVMAVLIPIVGNVTSSITAAQTPSFDVEPTITITRNDGGGLYYGTHEQEESYVDNGKQYYRDGDIIQVEVSLPQGHGSSAVFNVVKYDNEKLQLLSTMDHIKYSMASNYMNAGWDPAVGYYEGETNQISTISTGPANEFEGGNIAVMYFKVKPGVESTKGTDITFEFPNFNSATRIEGERMPVNNHKGFIAGDESTYEYHPESITIQAKTPSAPEPAVKPTLELTANTVTVYEGDIVNPKDYIKKASCTSDANVNKDSVVITGGTDETGKHQPVAGNYEFTYKVTNASNETTEKTLKLNVLERTYTVKSVETAGQGLNIPAGTTDAEFEEILEGLLGKEFVVNVEGNDGSKFKVKGTVFGGETDEYEIDGNDVLTTQTFNMKLDLLLPAVVYNENGEREIVSLLGRAGFASLIDDGTAEAVIKIRVGAGSTTPGNDSTGSNNGSTGHASIAAGNSGAGTDTGDTTNTAGFMTLLALSGLVLVGTKLRKTYR
ncbi:hypothetical protein M2475_001743 [Breznakia sp. PF5-3]|uniref:hypothetical protein n=1 Tax=unclassified Breznakia TaxID=2623764 RepID=UPI00240496E2|nr:MULTISPECIES: hypothetical protein [unclassified Breznakia]MDF9825287.1 hypothetical protein [Breznakia sp. PM6-1]MDF9836167.1 hypothetical protein [Breznakia sp. PF5-3]MDF9837387.1 hypothetical protein [Breznakia sp. PFB2-8]MDF9859322.1 hypothetical protein [Breznakia sp. PH5-24]